MIRLMCSIKPDYNTCCSCVDQQISHHIFKDCSCCELAIDNYEIVDIKTRLFRKDIVWLLRNNKIHKVPINRIFNVRYMDMEKNMNDQKV